MTDPSPYRLDTEDWHTAGAPFRILYRIPSHSMPAGRTVLERRNELIQHNFHPLDTLRKFLSHEPRGHADMFGGFIIPPDDLGAHFGVLFWDASGFPTNCGHGLIALGYWAVSKGLVKASENEGVDVVIDAPSGRVVVSVTVKHGKPVHADFIHVLSYQIARGLSVAVPSLGREIEVDLAFAGVVIASVNAAHLGLDVMPRNADKFITLQREIKSALGDRATYVDYELHAVIFFEEDNSRPKKKGLIIQRSVTVYGDGRIDRSPGVSATCARVAILHSDGRVQGNSKLLNHSMIRSVLEAEIVGFRSRRVEDFEACEVRVGGQAHLVAQSRFLVDDDDPLLPGFLLR
ncbi:hypothetical protein AbraIFM66951_009713 [Aspergillus brasiliensis]|uniref:trans-L-3-hydroxyproline dehydratase n=1 Tax=Aspergillus brasiliensis TaxID=319629 RepID=A0A9W5YUT1_9EURO|nr:hypothetical protein AbraCBS73388_009769 [Aspergillus brasiliensis]GKZ46584.1 hypothetical protein AbraIFM66951_009713 [Aspergillus brasiliensis]